MSSTKNNDPAAPGFPGDDKWFDEDPSSDSDLSDDGKSAHQGPDNGAGKDDGEKKDVVVSESAADSDSDTGSTGSKASNMRTRVSEVDKDGNEISESEDDNSTLQPGLRPAAKAVAFADTDNNKPLPVMVRVDQLDLSKDVTVTGLPLDDLEVIPLDGWPTVARLVEANREYLRSMNSDSSPFMTQLEAAIGKDHPINDAGLTVADFLSRAANSNLTRTITYCSEPSAKIVIGTYLITFIDGFYRYKQIGKICESQNLLPQNVFSHSPSKPEHIDALQHFDKEVVRLGAEKASENAIDKMLDEIRIVIGVEGDHMSMQERIPIAVVRQARNTLRTLGSNIRADAYELIHHVFCLSLTAKNDDREQTVLAIAALQMLSNLDDKSGLMQRASYLLTGLSDAYAQIPRLCLLKEMLLHNEDWVEKFLRGALIDPSTLPAGVHSRIPGSSSSPYTAHTLGPAQSGPQPRPNIYSPYNGGLNRIHPNPMSHLNRPSNQPLRPMNQPGAPYGQSTTESKLPERGFCKERQSFNCVPPFATNNPTLGAGPSYRMMTNNGPVSQPSGPSAHLPAHFAHPHLSGPREYIDTPLSSSSDLLSALVDFLNNEDDDDDDDEDDSPFGDRQNLIEQANAKIDRLSQRYGTQFIPGLLQYLSLVEKSGPQPVGLSGSGLADILGSVNRPFGNSPFQGIFHSLLSGLTNNPTPKPQPESAGAPSTSDLYERLLAEIRRSNGFETKLIGSQDAEKNARIQLTKAEDESWEAKHEAKGLKAEMGDLKDQLETITKENKLLEDEARFLRLMAVSSAAQSNRCAPRAQFELTSGSNSATPFGQIPQARPNGERDPNFPGSFSSSFPHHV